jgi:hypothetical protein
MWSQQAIHETSELGIYLGRVLQNSQEISECANQSSAEVLGFSIVILNAILSQSNEQGSGDDPTGSTSVG